MPVSCWNATASMQQDCIWLLRPGDACRDASCGPWHADWQAWQQLQLNTEVLQLVGIQGGQMWPYRSYSRSGMIKSRLSTAMQICGTAASQL